MSGCPLDLTALHGPQGLTAEDEAWTGSRFAEVKKALLDNPYQEVWSGVDAETWPIFRSTVGNAFAGLLPGGRRDQLGIAAARAVDSRADLRWGSDRKGWRRILHPNGICLLGLWEITRESPFSGYFRNGSRGLIISRLSPEGTATRRGQTRSFGLTGKIYPTSDPDHLEPLAPASFFTQQDLGGERTTYLDEVTLRNAPDVTAHRRGFHLPVLLRSGLIFKKVDRIADVRQLHEIAELAKPEGELTACPELMELRMSPGQPRIEGQRIDFRDEVYALLFEPGDPLAKRTLTFDISVADRSRVRGFAAFKRIAADDWSKIGRITFDHAVASYNGDHVIHFPHPRWRTDRNDPASTIRSQAGSP